MFNSNVILVVMIVWNMLRSTWRLAVSIVTAYVLSFVGPYRYWMVNL